jgi:hypothetical protein
MRREEAHEQGAVAVLVALLCVVLFSVSALAVDLSNAFVRTRDVQRQADFAALAGGADLSTERSGTVPSAVVNAVRDQLNGDAGMNLPQDDAGQTAVTASDLVDADLTNGEVRFANGGLQVIAPEVRVDYTFARIMGFDQGNLSREATVGLFSPGMGVMPVYAVSGCDYGLQPITDPASGADPTIPPLAHDSDSNATTLTSVTPQEVALHATGVSIEVVGKDFVDVTKVGFFRSDDDDPDLVEEVVATDFSPPQPGGYTKNGKGSVTVTVPDAVAGTEKAWYIRVYSANVNEWSARQTAQPFRVGEAVLECTSDASDGNFGTLKLPRNTPTQDSSWLPVNFADGLEAPLSLAIHENSAADGLCSDGVNGAVVSVKPNLREGTNCVDTDTGLPANVATDGLINGSSGYPGRLAATESSTSEGGGCAPDGSTAPRTVSTPGNKTINDDVLTCFLTDGSTSLYDIARPDYSGGAKLSPDIYDSPRFYWQPVLKAEPANGSSSKYSIIDFRPGFITDESVLPGSIQNSGTATADNGILIQGNQIKQLKVVFFNADALPAHDSGQVLSPFLGVGPKILRLID